MADESPIKPTDTTATDPAKTATEVTAADPAKTATVLDTTAKDDAPVATQADWPTDWRLKMASGDEKLAKRLDRYASPGDVAKAYRNMETKLSSGNLKPAAPPENATAEDVAAWRKEAGIPEKPEGYLEHLDKGLVIGDEDKEAIGKFLSHMHEANASPTAVKQALDWYYKNFEEQQAAVVEKDDQMRAAVEDELRPEWGDQYRRNVNIINSFLQTAPEGVADKIANARSPDGAALLNDPHVLRFLLQTATEVNPAATVAPGAAASSGVSIEARKAELEKMMGDRKSEYWKGPTAEKLQQEYRDLTDAEQRLKARGRAA